MFRSNWTGEQINEALNYIRAHYTFQNSKYPANVKHNKTIFKEINGLYENMFCGVLEVYQLVNNTYNHLLFCPVCGKRNGFKNDHCSNTCAQLDKNVRDKIAATNLRLYGDVNYNNPEKNKQTCIKKYGCENVFQSDYVKKLSEETKIKRYGDGKYTNVEKQKATKLNNVDENGLNVYERANRKTQDTMLRLYGVKTPMEKEEFKNNLKNTMLNKYGVSNILQLADVRRLRKKSRSSYKEKLWLNNLGVLDNKNNRQVFCENLYFDGLQNNVVYEFLGDYYHGNPKRLGRYSAKTQKRYKDFYNKNFIKTKERFDKIINLGYKIHYCWESDFDNDNYSYRVYKGKLEY